MQDLALRAGLGAAAVVGPFADTDGDGLVILGCGALRFRLVRDRDQEFIDVASGHRPDAFVYIDDLAVAFGWLALSAVVARTAPANIAEQISLLGLHREQLIEAFAPDAIDASLERIASERSQRVVARHQWRETS